MTISLTHSSRHVCRTTGWRAWSPALNAPVKASLAPFGPRERPRLFLCRVAGQHIRMQPPARDVIPIKELGRPAILESISQQIREYSIKRFNWTMRWSIWRDTYSRSKR